MSIQVAGTAAVVFGTNGSHSRALLKSACEAQGWDKMVTRPPSKHAALDAAVREVASALLCEEDAPLSVRALESDLSFEAVRIKRGATRNTSIHILSAQHTDTHGVRLLDCSSQLDAPTIQTDVQAAYDKHVDLLAAPQVQGVVANVVRKLGGVSLGGRNVYYIPQSGIVGWCHWKDAAQMWRYHSVKFAVADDPATVEHIISQLNVEVSETSQRVMQAIEAGDLTPKAARMLAKTSKQVIDKIKSYEAALGQQLDWMSGPLESAQSALAVSSLLSASI